jgi:hypothetical protein
VRGLKIFLDKGCGADGDLQYHLKDELGFAVGIDTMEAGVRAVAGVAGWIKMA